MSLPPPTDLTAFFDLLCDAAAKQTLPRFRQPLSVTNKLKGDFDPVTEADREAEKVIREIIETRFPDHGIVGEEFGSVRESARYQWIIDPVDGTRAFISGVPVWGTLIGLYDNGKPIAGVMDQPFTGERYAAIARHGSLRVRGVSATALQTSSVDQLDSATLMTTSPDLFTSAADQQFFEVQKQVRLSRYGCDCYAYCLLAAGHIELVVESGLNIYDIAALIPIIESAGGLVTSWSGGDASKGGTILAAANADIHRQAMALLDAA